MTNRKLQTIDTAIQSRAHCVELYLSRTEVYEFIEHEILPIPFKETTRAHRQFCLWRMKSALKHSPIVPSARLYMQILSLWVHDRQFFNEHLFSLAPRSTELSMIAGLLDRHDTVGEAAQAFAKLTGKHPRTFFLLKAKYKGCL